MTTAPPSTRLRVCTREVEGVRELGELVDAPPDGDGPLCWLAHGDGIVGWGEAARITVSGRRRFAEAEAAWLDYASQLEVSDEVGLPGTGAVAFASFAFAAEPAPSVLLVPRVVLGRREGRCWVTEIDGPGPTSWAMRPVAAPGRVRYSDGQLPVADWRAAVTAAVARLRRGELAKVALAHDVLAETQAPIDPRFLLRELVARYPGCWTFAVDGLVGATPELLLRRKGTAVSSRVLAGTTWPGEGDPGPLLLGSAKEREEHRLAVESLTGTLRPFCASLEVAGTPSVLPLRNVSHLATEVRGTLHAAAPASLLTLAGAVHPTAAVGGTPRRAAVALIRELERMDRGRYAGPVGWIDAAGDGEFGIALRCAQLSGRHARLFAGCGLVAGSDPDTEVREAAAKLVAVRDALES